MGSRAYQAPQLLPPGEFPLRSGGTLVDPINELAAKYHKLYWFTDGYHSGDLADNVKVILVGRESGYTTNNVTPHEKDKKA